MYYIILVYIIHLYYYYSVHAAVRIRSHSLPLIFQIARSVDQNRCILCASCMLVVSYTRTVVLYYY